MSHDEVARWAAAADAGLLLRESNIINRVASPTKFAEYLSVGIPVLITDSLADFARIVEEDQVGRVVASDAAPGDVASSLASMLSASADEATETRLRCRASANSRLSPEAILPIYRDIYQLPDGADARPRTS